MTVGYQVDFIGIDEAIRTFENADKIIQQEFTTAMQQSVGKLAGTARKLAPVGVSGELRASITSEVVPLVGYDVQGKVGSPLPYAVFVEMGTKPHYPPLAPLALWVQRVFKLRSEAEIIRAARGVQRSIGLHGTRPQPFLKNAFEIVTGSIYLYFDRALERIASRLAKE